MKKGIKITFETERLLVITARRTCFGWCAACGDRVRMITVDEAAVRAGTSALAIYRMAEAGEVHFIETAAGALLICLNSLSDSISNQ